MLRIFVISCSSITYDLTETFVLLRDLIKKNSDQIKSTPWSDTIFKEILQFFQPEKENVAKQFEGFI